MERPLGSLVHADKTMLADCLAAAVLSVAILKSPTLSTTTLDKTTRNCKLLVNVIIVHFFSTLVICGCNTDERNTDQTPYTNAFPIPVRGSIIYACLSSVFRLAYDVLFRAVQIVYMHRCKIELLLI